MRKKKFEKGLILDIEKGIMNANLGLNPQNDGTLIRILVPALTEDRRRDLVKTAKAETEHGKVSLRTIRKDANEAIKKLQKDGLPEDEAKDGETKVQELTNTHVLKCDSRLESKGKEIMTV